MATYTVDDFTEASTPVITDFLLMWVSSAGAHRKLAIQNFFNHQTDVGVGTNAPLYSLHVKRTAADVSVMAESDTGNAGLLLDAAAAADPYVKFMEGGTGKAVLGVDGSDADKFKLGTGTAATPSALTTVAMAVDTSQNVTFGAAVTVTGAVTLSSTLAVTGATTFNGNVTFAAGKTLTVGTGATSLGGTLAVTGAVTLASTLAVTGAATFATNVTMSSGTMTIQGAEATAAFLVLEADNGDDNADTWRLAADTSGNFLIQDFGSGSYVTNLTISNTGVVTVANTLTVTGAVTFSSTLAVTGAVTLSSTLTVTGTATFNGTVDVNGNFVSNTAEANSLVVWGDLTVGGDTTLSGTTTTAAAANLVLETNIIKRSTSARKYKRDITPLPADLGLDLVRRLQPVTYRSACPGDDPARVHAGLVADDVAAAGGGIFVTYGQDGHVEGLQYERLVASLVAAVQTLERRLAELEAQ